MLENKCNTVRKLLLTSRILLSIPRIPYPCSSLSLYPSCPKNSHNYKFLCVNTAMWLMKRLCTLRILAWSWSASSWSLRLLNLILRAIGSLLSIIKHMFLQNIRSLRFILLYSIVSNDHIIRTSSLNWSWYISTGKTQLMLQREIDVVKFDTRSPLYFCWFWWHH